MFQSVNFQFIYTISGIQILDVFAAVKVQRYSFAVYMFDNSSGRFFYCLSYIRGSKEQEGCASVVVIAEMISGARIHGNLVNQEAFTNRPTASKMLSYLLRVRHRRAHNASSIP